MKIHAFEWQCECGIKHDDVYAESVFPQECKCGKTHYFEDVIIAQLLPPHDAVTCANCDHYNNGECTPEYLIFPEWTPRGGRRATPAPDATKKVPNIGYNPPPDDVKRPEKPPPAPPAKLYDKNGRRLRNG